jgi:pimeloyl-ACP methyl ester carboxylesterase
MRVLFVCGFNASLRACDAVCAPVREHFAARGDDVEYFTHTWIERAPAVYARLCATLARNRHDAVVAHSLGGALVARYLTRHPERAPARVVVLCAPLLTRDNVVLAALARVPLLGLVPVPARLVTARASERASVCCLYQPQHVYRHWLGAIDLAVLERDAVHVVYAADETVAPIGGAALVRAAHVHFFAGDHDDFGAPESLAALDGALDSGRV